jgi:hypothetical protein
MEMRESKYRNYHKERKRKERTGKTPRSYRQKPTKNRAEKTNLGMKISSI